MLKQKFIIYLLSRIEVLQSVSVLVSIFLGIVILILGIDCLVDYDMFHNNLSNITKEVLDTKFKLLIRMIIVFIILMLVCTLLPSQEVCIELLSM